MTSPCPSDLRLEGYLLDPERSGLAQHVGGCEGCRVRLERMNAEAEEFRQYVFPATIDAVVAAAVPRPRPGWMAVFLPVAAACAAAMVFLLKPVPPEGILAARGEVLSLEVFTGSSEGARQLTSGELLPEGAPLRFRVKTTVPCRVRIVSADCEGHVAVLYPPPGEDSPIVSGTSVLPGEAKLGASSRSAAASRFPCWPSPHRSRTRPPETTTGFAARSGSPGCRRERSRPPCWSSTARRRPHQATRRSDAPRGAVRFHPASVNHGLPPVDRPGEHRCLPCPPSSPPSDVARAATRRSRP
jgi:hypothetical protein